MNGYEFARRFRADPQFQNLVLIAITGRASDQDKRRPNARPGFDADLAKPVDLEASEAAARARADPVSTLLIHAMGAPGG